jgi:hypothetical protein
MTQPRTAVVSSSFLRLLKSFLLSNLLMVGGIAIGLVGLGTWTVVACGTVVVVSTVLYVIAAFRHRPRVVISPEGFAFEKVFGRNANRWEDIEGRFAIIKIGWNQAVAFRLTLDYKTRTGKKPNSLFSGYDAAVVGSALPRSPSELAELLNELKQLHFAAALASSAGEPADLDAAPDHPRS